MNQPSPSKEELAKAILLLCCLVSFLVACFILRQEYDKHRLRRKIELLEGSLDQKREENLLQLDSLQESAAFQLQVNRELKDSLALLQQKRKELILKTDGNKAAIIRIRDVDSLHNAVAKNYR